MSVAKHTAYNLAGSIVPIGVTLITVPLYLKAIGLERYGVLALVWVLAGYFAFFDFGIGRATARKMATLAAALPDARNRLVWTSAAITGVLAVSAALVFWPAAQLFVQKMDIPAALGPELVTALPLIVAAIPIGIIQSLLGGILEGRRAFAQLNALGVIASLLTAVIPLMAALFISPRLPVLIAATLVSRVVGLLALTAVCYRNVPIGKPAIGDRSDMRDLFAFGGWVTLTGIVGPLLVYFDRYAIGAWIGATAVGFYVIAYNLIAQLQILPTAFSRAIFPRLAELSQIEGRGRGVDAVLVMAALVTPMTVIAMLAASPFLTLWLGEKVAHVSGPIAVILLVGFWSNSIAFVAFARVQAGGRPDLTAKLHLAELLPYALLLYVSIREAGLVGAALTWSIRCIVDFLFLAHLAGLLGSTWKHLAPGPALVVAAGAIALGVRGTGIHWTLAVVLTLLTLSWSWAIVPTHLRSQIVSVVREPLQKRRRVL